MTFDTNRMPHFTGSGKRLPPDSSAQRSCCASSMHICSSTARERLSSIGVDYLDFGVAGGPSGAAAARLSGMVGGSEAALRRAMPIVALFCDADAVHHMGPPGSGHAVKAVNNMLLAANIATATEALTLLRKTGVSSEAALAGMHSRTSERTVAEAESNRACGNRRPCCCRSASMTS